LPRTLYCINWSYDIFSLQNQLFHLSALCLWFRNLFVMSQTDDLPAMNHSCFKHLTIRKYQHNNIFTFLCPHFSGGHLDLPLSVRPSFRLSVYFVSHVTQKEFDLESWNFKGMLISMCSCAPRYFRLDLFGIFRVFALDLVKICNFQLVSHVTKKVFDQESWNFTGMLISMWSCAPGYFRLDLFSIFRVFALDLVKICNFQLVSHVIQKVFDLESWNFIGMLKCWSACLVVHLGIVVWINLVF
jgi:hypothetical protein